MHLHCKEERERRLQITFAQTESFLPQKKINLMSRRNHLANGARRRSPPPLLCLALFCSGSTDIWQFSLRPFSPSLPRLDFRNVLSRNFDLPLLLVRRELCAQLCKRERESLSSAAGVVVIAVVAVLLLLRPLGES